MPLRVKSVAFGCDTVNRALCPQNIHRTLWMNCLNTRPRWHSRPVRRKRDQTACKPGSVPPPLPGTRRSFLWTDPRGPVLATYPDPSALRQAYPPSPRLRRARDPYSVLLLAGLAMPSLLPATRWALTPPFHPSPTSPSASKGKPCVASAEQGGLLSVALSLGSPPAGVTRRHVVVEPGLSSTPERAATARPSDPAG